MDRHWTAIVAAKRNKRGWKFCCREVHLTAEDARQHGREKGDLLNVVWLGQRGPSVEKIYETMVDAFRQSDEALHH